MDYNKLDDKKTDILFRHAQGSLTATSLAAVIITFIYWEYSSPWILLPWSAVFLGFNGFRHYLVRLYNRDHATVVNKDRWQLAYNSGLLISALLWGMIGVYALHTQPLHYSAIMILLCGYFVMGAAINYSVLLSSFLSFSLPLILPVIFYLLTREDNIRQTYGMLLVIFYAYAFLSALRHRSMTTDTIVYEINNEALLNDLKLERIEASRLNQELETDLKKLRRAEEQLRQEKDRAEEMARKLRTLSSRDGLTGIANRRNFDEVLAREWNRGIRSQTPLSLILCDIDYFKAYNDYFGHQEGDKCLLRVAHILEEHARRGGDLAARYGGEEFGIILPETSLENAADIAEQIRVDVEGIALLHPASAVSNIVTISLGVATIVPPRGQDPRSLIALADKLLYEAKQHGRNRVVTSRPGLKLPDQAGGEA